VGNIFCFIHPGIFGGKSIEFIRPSLLPIFLEGLRFTVDFEGEVSKGDVINCYAVALLDSRLFNVQRYILVVISMVQKLVMGLLSEGGGREQKDDTGNGLHTHILIWISILTSRSASKHQGGALSLPSFLKQICPKPSVFLSRVQ
jgi:hypothetical protein